MSFFTLVPGYLPSVMRMPSAMQLAPQVSPSGTLMRTSCDKVSAFNSPAHQHPKLLKTPSGRKPS